jgi:transposase
VLAFFGQLQPCVVAMEACGGAHFWGREIGKLGHVVRLIPPAFVKPFVERQKNAAADAEVICEAAMRPTMRFVLVKSEETQGAAMVFRIRELLIRQRTQAINALRGHPGEFGQIVRQGASNAARLIAVVEDPDSGLPADAIATLKVLFGALTQFGMLERCALRNGNVPSADGWRDVRRARLGDLRLTLHATWGMPEDAVKPPCGNPLGH